MFKKIALSVVFAFCALNGFSKAKETYVPQIQENVKLNKYNRQLGYQLINEGETVVFVFDAPTWKIQRPLRVFISGSFNGWTKKSGAWEMAKIKDTFFMLEVAKNDLLIPGDSGYPEYKFIVHAEIPYKETVCGKELVRYKNEVIELEAVSNVPGYRLLGNNLILFPEDNPEKVEEAERIISKAKKLKEYNLSDEADVAALTNFRLVPKTTNLYRGYHPYKISKPKLDTEKSRIDYVRMLLRQKGIKTIITLSGDETLEDGKEQLPVFITDIRRNKSQLFLEPKYNTVYYESERKEFGTMVAEVVRYINEHDGPYYVHDRLGIDQTGVVCAILSSFCGASWNEIAEDYQKSNEMQIKEYRDANLLKYSLEKIAGIQIDDGSDMKKLLSQYFINRKLLSGQEIEILAKKLNQ